MRPASGRHRPASQHGAIDHVTSFDPLGQRHTHRSVPASPDRSFTGQPALQHMPLKAIHLVRGSPAEHTAAAAGDRTLCPSGPHLPSAFRRQVLVHELGDKGGPAFRACPSDHTFSKRCQEGAILDDADSLDRQTPLSRGRDVLVHVPSHFMTPTVTNVLLLERLVPDRGVTVERAAERDVERHRVVGLVRERVDLGVVHLVRVELLRPLALLRTMPKLMKDRDAAQPSKLPVVGEAPCKRREIPVVAPEPVATELLRPIREDVDHLQVAESHGKIATDVPDDVQDKEQP